MALSAVSSGMGCFGVKAGLYSSGKGFFPSFEGNWEGFGWAVQQLYAPRRRGCDVMYLEYGDAGALHASLQSAAHQAATAKRGCLIRICPHRMEKPNPLPHAQCKGKCERL